MKEKNAKESEPDEEIDNEICPLCREKKLILTEREDDIPYFGRVYLFSMTCTACKFHKSDVECIDEKDPIKYTLEVSSEEDLKIRVVKSSQATIKIPHITTIEPGPAAQGYVTNVEGIMNRVKHQLENVKEDDEDKDAAQKARTMIKKLNRVAWGQEKMKIIIEDPSGNSAIISEKAVVEKLKAKKA